nr:hypothetical protein [Tanacetum cinerariifolium]GFA09786.1 hypothetical protein [Tanacetum cinerariifolium]
GNLPEAYIAGNTLRYQYLEWYEAVEDGNLKDEALKNKAIMEGIINKDDESHNEGWRRWDGLTRIDTFYRIPEIGFYMFSLYCAQDLAEKEIDKV